jgi:hypothetical protein
MSETGTGPYPPGWLPDAPRTPSRRREGNARWFLPLAVLGIAAATAVAGVLILTEDPPAATAANTPARMAAPVVSAADPGTLASAADIGAVAPITSDVTCQSWNAIQRTVTTAQSNGWDQRDASIPGADWTPPQRAQYQQVGAALRTAADQAVDLARRTPHRVMRELYEAFTAYSRAYAAALDGYQPAQDAYAGASTAALQAISEICSAADGSSAMSRISLVPAAAPPTAPTPADDPTNPERFIPQAGPTCARWVPAEATLAASAQPWLGLNSDLPIAQWAPDQRAVLEAAAARFRESSNTLEADGRGSGNPVFEDFAVLAAQYFRAFAAAVPGYTAADRSLGMTGLRLDTLVSSACQAAAAG